MVVVSHSESVSVKIPDAVGVTSIDAGTSTERAGPRQRAAMQSSRERNFAILTDNDSEHTWDSNGVPKADARVSVYTPFSPHDYTNTVTPSDGESFKGRLINFPSPPAHAVCL